MKSHKKHKQIELTCPKCGAEITCETKGEINASVVATVGLGVIFEPAGYEPPKDWLPDEVRCKVCKTVYKD